MHFDCCKNIAQIMYAKYIAKLFYKLDCCNDIKPIEVPWKILDGWSPEN